VRIIEIGLHICESYEIPVRHRKGPNPNPNHNPRIFAMAGRSGACLFCETVYIII